MASISKTVYPDILDDTVNKYDSTYYRTTKMKPVDVKPSIYINFNMIKKNNKKRPKFKVGDHLRITKYKNIFGKAYVPNWSEEVFMVKKVKNNVPWKYVMILMEK